MKSQWYNYIDYIDEGFFTTSKHRSGESFQLEEQISFHPINSSSSNFCTNSLELTGFWESKEIRTLWERCWWIRILLSSACALEVLMIAMFVTTGVSKRNQNNPEFNNRVFQIIDFIISASLIFLIRVFDRVNLLDFKVIKENFCSRPFLNLLWVLQKIPHKIL